MNPGIQFFYGIFDSRVSLRELRFGGGWVAFVSPKNTMLHIIKAVDQTPDLVGGGFPELLNVKDGAWEGLLFGQAMDGQGIVQVDKEGFPLVLTEFIQTDSL